MNMNSDVIKGSSIGEAIGAGILGAAVDIGIDFTPLGRNNVVAGLTEIIGGIAFSAIAPSGAAKKIIVNAGTVPGFLRLGRTIVSYGMGILNAPKAGNGGINAL